MLSFLHKHRNKLLAASAIAGITAAVVYYLLDPAEEETEEDEIIDETDYIGSSSRFRRKNGNALEHLNPAAMQGRAGNKSRLLLRIRKQYETALQQFMPTLKSKIKEVVDINGTVRQIKELRASALPEDSRELEVQLWEEIKVSSLTLLLVTCYMTCALCTLLKLQLYILAKSIYKPSENSDDFAAQSSGRV